MLQEVLRCSSGESICVPFLGNKLTLFVAFIQIEMHLQGQCDRIDDVGLVGEEREAVARPRLPADGDATISSSGAMQIGADFIEEGGRGEVLRWFILCLPGIASILPFCGVAKGVREAFLFVGPVAFSGRREKQILSQATVALSRAVAHSSSRSFNNFPFQEELL